MADKESELYEVERLGFTPTKNSGRGYIQKADGVLYSPQGDCLITLDVKETDKGFRLDEKVWVKLQTDAAKNQNSEPMLKVVIGADNPKIRLVVVTESFYQQLEGAWKEKYIDGE